MDKEFLDFMALERFLSQDRFVFSSTTQTLYGRRRWFGEVTLMKASGPGSIAQLRRDGALQGVSSITSDRFSVVTGPWFRELIPALVQDTLREMWLRSHVEVVLGLPVDGPDPMLFPAPASLNR